MEKLGHIFTIKCPTANGESAHRQRPAALALT
jgi:hypothetical protein